MQRMFRFARCPLYCGGWCPAALCLFFSLCFSLIGNRELMADGELTPQDVLHRTLESQRRSELVHMEVRVEWMSKRRDPALYSPPPQIITFEFSRDYDKINMIGLHLILWPDGSNNDSFRFRWTSDGVLATDYDIHYTRGETKPRGGVATHNMEDSRLRFLFPTQHGHFLDGYMGGFTDKRGLRISEMMLESPNLKFLDKEKIDGYDCYVVTAKLKFGSVTQWIDPAVDFHPRKIETIKGLDDFWDYSESTLSNMKRWTSIRSVLDQFEFVEIDSSFFPVKGIYHTDHEGTTEEDFYFKRAVSLRENINFSPEFSADTFKTDYPEDLLITNMDDLESGVLYFLEDGKIVSGYNYFTGDAEGKWSDYWFLRSIFIFVGAMMIFFALGRMLWERYKSS